VPAIQGSLYATAIDDFGAGSSGLTLFAPVMAGIAKLITKPVTRIHKRRV
jgi:EAL domain-containing protein (putative c-di-GMP-specific phosphodiesterase class I)